MPPDSSLSSTLKVRRMGKVPYEPTWRAMQQFCSERTADTLDELWMLEHPPVYTLGQSCKQPVEAGNDIPQVFIDRGGKITYHGPGQLVAYFLLDIKRRGWGPKRLVEALEETIIRLLAEYGVEGERESGAPGVYVEGKKISALGIRVKNGYTYHGLSLNVDMDLSPFSTIDPCGYAGLAVTQMFDLGAIESMPRIILRLTRIAGQCLEYENIQFES